MGRSASHVDFVFVVNGESTATFPSADNVLVIRRENTCYDFGSWGIGLQNLEQKLHTYKYFVFLNSSVRGPFLPIYFPQEQHWTSIFTNLITKQEKLVGLAINCPDGVGRTFIHVQSMLFATDWQTLQLLRADGIFHCSTTYQQAMRVEGDMSKLVLDKGYNLGSVLTGLVTFRH